MWRGHSTLALSCRWRIAPEIRARVPFSHREHRVVPTPLHLALPPLKESFPWTVAPFPS